ncbi:M1 family metallopeptidase [Lyngbya confervoides]
MQLDNQPNRFELPGAKPNYVPDRPGQVEHIFLDLALDIPQQHCAGTCHLRLNPIRDGIASVTLDAVNLNIQAVKVDKHPQDYDYDGHHLTIPLSQPTQAGKALTFSIDYSLDHPQRGLYFIAPSSDYPEKPTQVWTQGEDEDSRYWFPCFDYPGQLATSEVRVKVPQGYRAISNGELLETICDGNEQIFHWKQQQVHPTYLMTLAVGQFVELRDEWTRGDRTVPVTYYVAPGLEESARISMGKTPRMIEFFSNAYGYDYAYPKYAQICVDDFIFGGMENTSTTLLTDRCLLDERAALDNRSTETLVAHELAHQWFGDLVVIKHWSHAWIKEGMASYSEVMWTEQEYGPDEAAYYRLREARNYLSEDKTRYRRPVVTHIYRAAIELYDRHLYEKGSCIYHMIRHNLGEDLFWKAMHRFVQENAHQTVETVDLLRAIEEATGRNLLFLFDQYLYRGGHPDYQVSYRWDSDHKMAQVTIKQNQAKSDQNGLQQDLFDLTLQLGFGSVSDQAFQSLQTFPVKVREAEQSFYFALAEKPAFISFDVGNPTLKTLTLEYEFAELAAQLQFDPDPVSRIYAAEALAKKGGLKALKALETALVSDPFWGVRAEVATQIPTLKLDQAVAALKQGLKDPEARVRRSVVEAIAELGHGECYELIAPIAQRGDASYYVEAAALTGVGQLAANPILDHPEEGTAIELLQTALQDRQGWNEVVRCGAIAGLAHMTQSEPALTLLLQYTQVGTPQPLRLAAIRGLGGIAAGQREANLDRILQTLSHLANEPFFLTQVAVVAALGKLTTPKAVTGLRSLSAQTPDGRVRRLADEAIQKVQRAMDPQENQQKIQEELDSLKKENQELKSRLGALEAKIQPKSP